MLLTLRTISGINVRRETYYDTFLGEKCDSIEKDTFTCFDKNHFCLFPQRHTDKST